MECRHVSWSAGCLYVICDWEVSIRISPGLLPYFTCISPGFITCISCDDAGYKVRDKIKDYVFFYNGDVRRKQVYVRVTVDIQRITKYLKCVYVRMYVCLCVYM